MIYINFVRVTIDLYKKSSSIMKMNSLDFHHHHIIIVIISHDFYFISFFLNMYISALRTQTITTTENPKNQSVKLKAL